MIKFIKKIFCRHRAVKLIRNIYGDEINMAGGNRSIWECEQCGKRLLSKELSYRIGDIHD